ncbi:MAG: hypothetical protein ACXAC2_06860, partial [Candidatus Kariarchaeaceae archaeon]
QWSIKAYDMNQIEDLMLQGTSMDRAIKSSTYERQIGSLIQGSHVFLEIYSFDVQHGLLTKDLGLSVVINGRQPSDDYHIPVFKEFDLPENDATISLSCHVYCGLGHSEMKLNFIIGIGSPNYSRIVFNIIIALNLVIFLTILLSFFKRAPVKIVLYPLESVDFDDKLMMNALNHNSKSDKKIGIFKINHLSEKQIVLLRFNRMRIKELGKLIGYYNCENVKEAKYLAETGHHSNNWKIVN